MIAPAIANASMVAYVDPFDRICLGLGKTATTDLKEAFLVYQIPIKSLKKHGPSSFFRIADPPSIDRIDALFERRIFQGPRHSAQKSRSYVAERKSNP